jgi:hypothetical protein
MTWWPLLPGQAALAAFRKLHSMLPDNYDVLWQMASCYDILGDFKQVGNTWLPDGMALRAHVIVTDAWGVL